MVAQAMLVTHVLQGGTAASAGLTLFLVQTPSGQTLCICETFEICLRVNIKSAVAGTCCGYMPGKILRLSRTSKLRLQFPGGTAAGVHAAS